MAVQKSGNNLVYGLGSPLANLPPQNVFAKRAPTSADSAPLGTVWIYVNIPTVQIYILTYAGNWTEIPTDNGSGTFSSLVVNGPTALNGMVTVNTDNNPITMISGTGAINISADATNTSINIGTGAGVKNLVLGSTNTTSSTTINVGSGGLNIPSFTNAGALVSTAAGVITSTNANTAGYILTSNGAGSVPTFQPGSGASITVNGNSGTITGSNLNILGTGSVTTSGSGTTLTISASGSGLTWTNVTSGTQTLATQQAYISNNGASLVTFTLPATAAVGDYFQIAGSGTGGWTIAQNSGQTIRANGGATTTGIGGSVSSSSQYDFAALVCNIANTGFVIYQSTGILNFV